MLRRTKLSALMLSMPHRDAMRITDIVPSCQLAAGQVFGREAVQHFQLELTRVSTALASKAGTAVMLICTDPSPNTNPKLCLRERRR